MSAQAFKSGGLFIVGDGETLDDVQDGEAWLATTEPVEVRR